MELSTGMYVVLSQLFFPRRFSGANGILYAEVCLPMEKVPEWPLLIVYHCLNPLQRSVLLPG